MSKEVFHYAPAAYLPRILQSGHLRPSNAGAPKERPLLWFSTRQDWEPTATKMKWDPQRGLQHMTFAEQLATVGCIRFALPANDERLLTWIKACKVAGTPARLRQVMELSGRLQGGDPANWFAVTCEVPLLDLRLEVLRGSKWRCADDLVGAIS